MLWDDSKTLCKWNTCVRMSNIVPMDLLEWLDESYEILENRWQPCLDQNFTCSPRTSSGRLVFVRVILLKAENLWKSSCNLVPSLTKTIERERHSQLEVANDLPNLLQTQSLVFRFAELSVLVSEDAVLRDRFLNRLDNGNTTGEHLSSFTSLALTL